MKKLINNVRKGKSLVALIFLLTIAPLCILYAVNVPIGEENDDGSYDSYEQTTAPTITIADNPKAKAIIDSTNGHLVLFPVKNLGEGEFTVTVKFGIPTQFHEDNHDLLSAEFVDAVGLTFDGAPSVKEENGKKILEAKVKVAVGASQGRLAMTFDGEKDETHPDCNVTFSAVQYTTSDYLKGFDPILTLEDEYAWASVAVGKQATHIRFEMKGAAMLPVEFKLAAGSTGLTVDTVEATGDVTNVKFTGGAVEQPTICTIEAQYDGSVISSLKVVVLPKRKIKVDLVKLIDSLSDSLNPDRVMNTSNFATPNSDNLIEKLNEVYFQCAIEFEMGGGGTQDVAYDINQDGRMQGITWNESVELFDEATASTELMDVGSLMNVIYVANSGVLYEEGQTYARAIPRLSGNTAYAIPFVNNLGVEIVPLAAAHEFGHLLHLTSVPAAEGGTHDPGPFPENHDGLMRSGAPEGGVLPSSPGKIISHEDWTVANETAKDFEVAN